MSDTVQLDDIEKAAERLRPVAVLTPLLESALLDQAAGGRVLLKPECLQLTGSFKIRGAYNFLCQLDGTAAARGVVAFSSGNHAQGVAAAGSLLGIPTAIVMPEDAPAVKLQNTRRLGGEIISYDRYSGSREDIAGRVAAERGATLVPSYDHVRIIAGQGTVGLEIMQQCDARGLTPDQVLICCGGGGLSSGSAVAIKALSAETCVHTVEPEGFDDTARSLMSGRRETNNASSRSICDALLAESPGKITFAINRLLASAGLVVSDDEVKVAMRFAFEHLKLVLEPGGAVALAAVLAGKAATGDRVTVVVLSGGNVDAEMFAAIQAERRQA